MASAVANLINDLRQRAGLKGSDVANIAAVSQATVSRWRSGTSFPHPKIRLLISDLRSVVDRLAELYDPEETRPKKRARRNAPEETRPKKRASGCTPGIGSPTVNARSI